MDRSYARDARRGSPAVVNSPARGRAAIRERRSPPPSAVERQLRVVIVGPQGVGGQAHAARDILAGFAEHRWVRVDFQAIDPRLPGRWRFLTEWKIVRSVVRP